MNLMSSVRMPVGKYKGQDLDVVMASDPGYIEWISGEEWFRQQYTQVYKIIVNGDSDLQESPEHNALQARFLDEEVRMALASHLLPEVTDTETLIPKAESAFLASINFQGYDREYTKKFPKFSFGKQSVEVYDPTFEYRGVDVCFGAGGYVEVFKRGRNPRMTIAADRRFLFVELKPTLGDQYPAVLRQILGAKSRVFRDYDDYRGSTPLFTLVTERYTASSVSWEKAQQFFASQDVDLVLLGDIAP
jgi:hypothetical protein